MSIRARAFWILLPGMIASVPLVLLGVTIAFALSEQTYQFLATSGGQFTPATWRRVVAGRVVGWLLAPLALAQVAAIGLAGTSVLRSTPSPRLRAIAPFALYGVGCVFVAMLWFWASQMASSASIMRAMQKP